MCGREGQCDYRRPYLKRGSILAETEAVDYERFLPKAEFITQSNRFSPVGVEWLYLAVSRRETRAEECTIKECRASSGNRFGICTFALFEDEDKKSQIRICTLGSSGDRVSQFKTELLPVWYCSNG